MTQIPKPKRSPNKQTSSITSQTPSVIEQAPSITMPLASKPVTEKAGDNWHVAIFPHPVVKTRFSYSLTINNRIRRNPSPIDDSQPNLFGCFSTPQEAINAAIEEVADE